MTTDELDAALKEIEQIAEADERDKLIKDLVQRLTEYPAQ